MSRVAPALVIAAAIVAALVFLRVRLQGTTAAIPRTAVEAFKSGAEDQATAANTLERTNAVTPSRPGNGGADADVATEVALHGPSPQELENQILQHIAALPGVTLTSITSVECDDSHCEIAFTGTDVNPRYVGPYSELSKRLQDLVAQGGLVAPLTGGIGTREIAPGAKEYVTSFTYVAVDPPSGDPVEAARQQAACAGAWSVRAEIARSRNLDEIAREASEAAQRALAVASAVLGRVEADRTASSRASGPLIADCVPARMWIPG